MPTGYTAAVQDGATFEQFAMRCARAMGACVTMRDDPSDKPIPDRFEPSQYNADAASKAQIELDRIKGLTTGDCEMAALADHDGALSRYHERRAKQCLHCERYRTMLAAAEAWVPPSPDHNGLRAFMIEQLRQSIDWDCDDRYDVEPVLQSGAKWQVQQVNALERQIDSYLTAQAEENDRVAKRNAWIALLRSSL